MSTSAGRRDAFSADDHPSLAVAARFAKIAFDDAGLTIRADNVDFFKQRVSRRLRALNMAKYQDYAALVEGPEGASERRILVEALTTHTTNFFRESQHYDFLQSKGLDALVERGAGRERSLTVWSAACSNGAELYSAMIVCREYAEQTGTTLRLEGIGTDISRRILKHAQHAVYTADEIGGLSEDRRRRHLLRSKSGKPQFRIDQDLRRLCRWTLSNLTDPSPAGPGEVDIAFLRNVLIYFDRPTQERVVNTIAARMRPGAYLMTGHSESLSSPPPSIRQVASCIYRKDP